MNVDRVKVIYGQLEQYEVTLDPDPVSRGPRYLQGLIAETRNFLNLVSRVQLEVHREKQIRDRDLRAREAAYQVSFDELLANDERIRRLPNIEDRKSTAKMFLRDEISVIEALKSEIHDLEYVEKAVRHRHRELSSTMSEIKLQKSLIATEIQTGAMYGDERTTLAGTMERSSGPAGVAIDEDELNALFEQGVPDGSSVSPEPVLAMPPEPTPEPVLSAPVMAVLRPEPAPKAAQQDDEAPAKKDVRPATVEEVSAFLGMADSMGAALDDFDDVFSNL